MLKGFAPTSEIFDFILSGKAGRLLEVSVSIQKEKSWEKTRDAAVKLAAKIFALVMNPEDEEVAKDLYYSFDKELIDTLAEAHIDLGIDLDEPYLIVRMKHNNQWVKAPMRDGGTGRVELVSTAAAKDRMHLFKEVNLGV